jgi:hypothetical protein
MNFNILTGIFRKNIWDIVFESDLKKAYQIFKNIIKDAIKEYVYVKPGRQFERIKKKSKT